MPPRKQYKKPYEQPPPSPIEISFWETAKPPIPELQREVWINKKYRVDFLIPSKKIVIELYGYQHHNTKQKLTEDAKRERYLQRLWYQVIGFTGTEVFKDVRNCVDEVLAFAKIQPANIPVNSSQTGAQPSYITNTMVAPPIDKPINVPAKAKSSVVSILYGGITISLSLIFLVVVVIAISGVMRSFFSPPPSSVPEFFIRTENDAPDNEVKKVITNSMLKWQKPKSPGKSQWQVTFPVNEPALISLGWCATNKTILEENWSHLRYSLLIDNNYVELVPKEWVFENEEGVCRGYSEKLSGWAVGRHSFYWFYHLDQTLNNGKDTYQSGEYVIEITADVK
jgi:hypothetical protein